MSNLNTLAATPVIHPTAEVLESAAAAGASLLVANLTEDWDATVRKHPRERFAPIEIVVALAEVGGYVTRAAKQLDCSSMTIHNAVRRYAPLKQALAAIRNERTRRTPVKLLAPPQEVAKPRSKSRKSKKVDA
jgi:hypothetical protein